MNIRQLSCFAAAADEGSFTRAALLARDHPAVALPAHPPALGWSTKSAGLLFERRPRGASLTPAGRSSASGGPRRPCVPSSAAARAPGPRSPARWASSRSRPCSRWRSASGRSLIRLWQRAPPERRDPPARVPPPGRLLEDAVEHGVADFGIGPLPLRELVGAARDGGVGGVRFRRHVRGATRSLGRGIDPDRGAGRPRVGPVPPRPRPRRGRRRDLPGAPASGRGGRCGRRRPKAPRASPPSGSASHSSPTTSSARASTARVLRFEPRLIREIAVYARGDWSTTAGAFVDVLRSDARQRPARRVLDRAVTTSKVQIVRLAALLAPSALLVAGCGGSSS